MQPALAPHPSMQSSAQDHADQVLHDQLLAAQQHLSAQGQEARPQGSAQSQNSNIDPAIAGSAMLAAANSQGAPLPQVLSSAQEAAAAEAARKTYGKRELSTSKRAAQNRAAQRAFRQRKEGYIRKLEEQVREYEILSESYKALQAENYQLREYIIGLQSRLIDSQNEVPALPENIDLSQPRPEPPALASQGNPGLASGPPPAGATGASASHVPHGQHTQSSAPPSNTTSEDINQLNRIAVAGLGMRKHPHEEEGYQGDRGSLPKVEPVHGLSMLS